MNRFFIGLIIIAISLQFTFASEKNVRILKSDINGLTIEYVPTIEIHKSTKINDVVFDGLTIEGVQPVPNQLNGAPNLVVF